MSTGTITKSDLRNSKGRIIDPHLIDTIVADSLSEVLKGELDVTMSLEKIKEKLGVLKY